MPTMRFSRFSNHLPGWLLFAVLGATAAAQPDFQFQVNATTPNLRGTLLEPSIGIATSFIDLDRMVFTWHDAFIAHIPIPVCDRMCDGDFVDDVWGGGPQDPTHVFLRRFSAAGAPLDATDVILATTTPNVDGPTRMSSTSVRRVPTPLFTGPSSFHTSWWSSWSWITAAPTPCGGAACDRQPVGWWRDLFPSFLSAPSTPYVFLEPGECQAVNPSTAFSVSHRLIAWREVLNPCRRLLFRIDDLPAPSGLVLRDHVFRHDVDRPCAAAALADRFAVAWREDNRESQNSVVNVARIDVVGGVPTVGDMIEVGQSAGPGPAISMFEDGSFAVQWVLLDCSGDCVVLVVQCFDSAEPPNPVGNTIVIEPSYCPQLRFTLAAKGASWDHPGARLATAYEVGGDCNPVDILGRAIDPRTGAVGAAVVIPIGIETVPRVLGEMHQHTALLRTSDDRLATVWRGGDRNVYCTVRTLPPPANPCHGACVADVDDGSGTGTPDGGVTIEDLLYYLGIFDQGLLCADVDDGSGTGTPDGGVTIEDLLYFLVRFDAGC